MSEPKKPLPILGDNPIRSPNDDVLGRSKVARSFIRHVLALDASEGVAVGVFGPWGSGKTSFINLVQTDFEQAEIPVLHFNPWMFSGAEQLVERFFDELSAKMEKTDGLEKIGETLAKYGDALNTVTTMASMLLGMPQVGAIVDHILKTTSNISKQPRLTSDLREEIGIELKKRDKPIIVVLDDVDRLSGSEIRDIFKLVRLTASLPNLIYLVVCDRLHTEQALEETGLPGRAYLEKILQLPFNLPETPRNILQEQVAIAIRNARTGIENPGPFDEQAWHDVYWEIVRPLIRTMRDVRRYSAAFQGTVDDLDGQVSCVDVLGLEAIRVFLPDVFSRLPGAIDGLTLTSQDSERRLDTEMKENPDDPLSGFNKWRKEQIDGLIEATRTNREVVEAMIDLLFPSGARLRRMSDGDSGPYLNEEAVEKLRERRVAHGHILRLYLEHVVGSDLLALQHTERAFELMIDLEKLDGFLRSLKPALWHDVVLNLCDLEDRFCPEQAEPGIVVLLNLLPDVPERLTGVGFLDELTAAVRRATYRLLRAMKDPAAVEAAVRRILPEVTSLSSRVELVLHVGHREGFGRKLLSETAVTGFEKILLDEIRSASIDDLAGEHKPAKVLSFAKSATDPSEDPFDIDDSPKLNFKLLWTSQSVEIGDRAFRRNPSLDWSILINVYGDEKRLKGRIEALHAQFEDLKPWIESQQIPLDEARRLLELADSYARGWRPEAN